MTLILIIVALIAFATLAMRQAPLWQWAGAALVLGLLSRIGWGGAPFAADLPGLIEVFLPGVVLAVLAIPAVRRAAISAPVYRIVKTILPRVSRTEQEALDAGTVGWDAELFSGKPRWDKLLKVRKAVLTAEEQAFLDGPTNAVCAMIDDWDIRHNRADMPESVWAYLKERGFLGMLISKEHGGLGFSAQAR
jgi:acyl-CoA dehydrogenase